MLRILEHSFGVRKVLLEAGAHRPFLMEELLERFLAFGCCRLFGHPALLSLVKHGFKFAYAVLEHGLAPSRTHETIVDLGLGLGRSVGHSGRIQRLLRFAHASVRLAVCGHSGCGFPYGPGRQMIPAYHARRLCALDRARDNDWQFAGKRLVLRNVAVDPCLERFGRRTRTVGQNNNDGGFQPKLARSLEIQTTGAV
ncbi:MAG: hypothetical protein ACRD3C_11255 [Vicinamibacterales bacterium]